jgi:multiple sugar transport system ATP-binding protein
MPGLKDLPPRRETLSAHEKNTMAKVIIENVYKTYPGDHGKKLNVVEDFNLEINDEEFVVFVGPSGCGKSTTLRMIAGLEEISQGSIYIDKKKVNDVPPKDRDIAMVFQNYALYPHMTVYDNMAFALQLRRFPKSEINQRVREAAQVLGLTDEMLKRKPKALSGGQRQRVALGRAIVRKPKVFLFDEPLSNLDAKMRVSMRAEIVKLHSRLLTTMIYVTHDQVEAMTMGDRIVVMKDGRIQQVAEPLQIYNQPANAFVAGFIGSPSINFFEGLIVGSGNQISFQEKASAQGMAAFSIALDEAKAKHLLPYVGKEVIWGIRPEDLEIHAVGQGSSPGRSLRAKVETVEPMGAETYLYLSNGTHPFIARSSSQIVLKPETLVEVEVNLQKTHFFEAADKSKFQKVDRGEFDSERWQAACKRII